VILHLAAIVSGEAEAEFDKGYRINLDGTRHLIDAIRAVVGGGYKPRLVFTSSIAVFGAPFPEKIGDEFFHTPLTSYGTQKATCELLIPDYTRKGLLDGISIRLPTICVRPGKPNKAASGFFSNIIREPLAGEEAVLPVSEDVRHWHASPKSAVGFLVLVDSLGRWCVGGGFVARRLACFGYAVAGQALLGRVGADLPYAGLFPVVALLGAGLGVFTAVNNTAVMASVTPEQRGFASGMVETTRQLGHSLGVSISSSVLAATLAMRPRRVCAAPSGSWNSWSVTYTEGVLSRCRMPRLVRAVPG